MTAVRAEVLTFDSGGSGARPTLDGLNATAFPSGGAGRLRGGLGQLMDVGAPTTIARDDGTPIRGKGRRFVPHGVRVQMAFPGGAGYGSPAAIEDVSARARRGDEFP